MLDPELSRRYLAAVGVVGWRLRTGGDTGDWSAPPNEEGLVAPAALERPKVSGAEAALAAIAAATGNKQSVGAGQGSRFSGQEAAAPNRPTVRADSASLGTEGPPACHPAAEPAVSRTPASPPPTGPTPSSPSARAAPPDSDRPELPQQDRGTDIPSDHPAFAIEQPPLDDDPAWYGATDGPPPDLDVDLNLPAGLPPATPARQDPADAIARMDWDALQAAVAACRRCQLCETRTQTVFGVGNREADLMLVGEAPGQEEDRRGEPFVGRAGQLLDRMLAAIGLDRRQVFIANVLKCRPPRNRDPLPQEAAACQHYLARQIALVRPRLLLCVGRISAQHLLQTGDSVGRLRGRLHHVGADRLPLIVTYHPSYYLRTPAAKGRGWEDLQRVARLLRDSIG